MLVIQISVFLASLLAIAQSVVVRFGTSNVYLRANANRAESTVHFSILRGKLYYMIIDQSFYNDT